MSANNSIAGSQQVSEPAFLIIGKIARTHGVSGEMQVDIHSDDPKRFLDLESILVGEDDPKRYPVESVRFHGKRAIIKLDGINSREDANELRNQYLLVTRDEAVSLEEGEMFFFELIGLEVKTVEGQVLGSITDIIQTGANDVFVVQTSSKELLIPDIPEVVLEIDRQSRVVTVQLLPGLIDDK